MMRTSTCVISLNLCNNSLLSSSYPKVCEQYCYMEAKPFQLSPMGHDIISKHKGQWFCPELRQKKQCGTPETIVPFGIGYFFFSDVKIYWFLKSSFIWKSSIVWYLRSWPLDVNCLTVTPTPLYTSADDLKLYNLSLPQLQNENDRINIIGLL